MGRKSKQQKQIEEMMASLSKEMLENPVVQVSLFYLLIVGIRKAVTSFDTQDPAVIPPAGQAFMEGYWEAVRRKFFGPLGELIPTIDLPTNINEFHLLELAILASIPLSAGSGLASGIKDIVDVLT